MPKSPPAKSSKQRATAPVKLQRRPNGPRTVSRSQIRKSVEKIFKARAMKDA